MKQFDRFLNYLVLALVVAVSVLWGVFDTWVPSQADLPRVLGFLLGLVAAATIHTWTRYSDLRKDVDRLIRGVGQASDTSGRLADAMEQQVIQRTFADAFSYAYEVCPRVRRLRVYAISTEIIQTFFWTLPFKIDKGEILLFEPQSDNSSRTFVERINAAIEGWHSQRRTGQIEELLVKRYTNFPTHYLVLLDDRIALWGTYHRTAHHYTGINASDPFVISGNHLGTRPLITEFTNWFDNAMAAARRYDLDIAANRESTRHSST